MMILIYQEENSPGNANKYKTPTGFSNYLIRKECYKVKDSADVVLNVKVSRHGPIMNNLIVGLDNKKPVAMSWIYTTTHSYSGCGLCSFSC
jgi:penicillin amidase